MTAILHTQSGNKLPIEFIPKLPWANKRHLANDVKDAFNNNGMLDKVVFVEIME